MAESSPASPYSSGTPVARGRGDSLADVLERVLDKGIVIAGDIRVDLLDIELLTIRIRLLVSSADKAEELGMSWWRHDPFFTGRAADAAADDGGAGALPDDTTAVLDRLADSTDELLRRMTALEAGNGNDATPTADADAADAADADAAEQPDTADEA